MTTAAIRPGRFISLRLGAEDVEPQRRHVVVPPPLIVEFRSGPLVDFDDQALRQEAVDGAVERARVDLDGPAGPLFHRAHDAVAVLIAFGQREEYLEGDGRQGQEVEWVAVASMVDHNIRL